MIHDPEKFQNKTFNENFLFVYFVCFVRILSSLDKFLAAIFIKMKILIISSRRAEYIDFSIFRKKC